MLFKNPAVLYALALLIIPILVHLFQLRRFKKEYFTNVAFLKKIQQQSRKSSKIKKWLVLLSRLLAFAAIIIAFAQPYFPAEDSTIKKEDLVVYLDNSFSMQQEGANGTLLNDAVQSFITSIPAQKEFTLFTNDKVYRNTSLDKIKNQLLEIDFTAKRPSLKSSYLKAQNLFSSEKNRRKSFLALTDFQANAIDSDDIFEKEIHTVLIPLQAKEQQNVSIDSAYIANKINQDYQMHIRVSSNKKSEDIFPIAIYGQEQLLAKSSISFADSLVRKVVFNLNEKEIFYGKIALEDQSLDYDNRLFFSINSQQKIKVAAISAEEDRFLEKIFNNKETFEFYSFKENEADYSVLENADFIVLNELSQIPTSLQTLLQQKLKQEKNVLIIPGSNIDISNYNSFLGTLNRAKIIQKKNQELKLTQIRFSHPLFHNVFRKAISNFDYPTIYESYEIDDYGSPALLTSDNAGFLTEKNHLYLFKSALNQKITNFKSSPLIVPVLYNMARQSVSIPQLYYEIGEVNAIDIPTPLNQDKVLHLTQGEADFIPLQRKLNEQVRITTAPDLPILAGNFEVKKQNELITSLGFNYNRKESDLELYPTEKFQNVEIKNSITHYFSNLRNQSEVDELWKWFVIFAILFLAIEMLLLKFLK
ncbi:BatA domain-containing protein [Mesonia ostreae]|uniref:BatA domain-containing protein n=1 Tax=Mesonia ostreae TaxID=861110 RepID=A0ABU2KEE4_9FLAO|nr:BatA domain-containing protein [Mesonia ostreae]MDT0293081.1 BatA domain-containing protein [Mesonia ostreae]